MKVNQFMKANDLIDMWKDQTVVCIASGPSLCLEDCELVKESGFKTLVTNNTYQLCDWADGLFAFDLRWWMKYKDEVKESKFSGMKLTYSYNARALDLISLDGSEWFEHFGNSGSSIISLAINAGAKRVVLLGYDCMKEDGKSHWHGEHPEGFGNCKSIGIWPKQFEMVKSFAKNRDVEIINCSRKTALGCFQRMELEDALQKN